MRLFFSFEYIIISLSLLRVFRGFPTLPTRICNTPMAPRMKKATKRVWFDTLLFRNEKCADNYEKYFSKCPVFAEHYMEQSILEDELLLDIPVNGG